MTTLEEINRQIDACPNTYIFWTRKEIRALPEIMDRGETIKALTSGMFNSCTWLAVCTDRRLIFINRGMFWGTELIQMPLDRVQSIDNQFTIFFGFIRVFDGINEFTLNMVLKSSILPFVKATQEAMYTMRNATVKVSNVNPSHPADVASQLEKLAELKEKGYLTDEEFQSQKRKLLSA
jgi:hypothetical protein